MSTPSASFVKPRRINAYNVNDESRIHDALEGGLIWIYKHSEPIFTGNP